MKILHVSESLIGGPASYLQEILPFQTREFSAENVALLAPTPHLEQLAGQFNGVVEPYNRSGRNLASLWRLAVALRRTLLRERPDIVHFHSSFAGAIGRLTLLTVRPRPRTLYCAHCWSFDRTRRTPAVRLWQVVERWLSRFTDRIINLSPHEQDLLRGAGFPMQRVALVVSGIADIDPSRRPPLATRPSGAPLRILFLGRFDEQKGADLLVDDLASVDPARATVDLGGGRVLDGPELTIPAGVTMLGWVQRAKLPELLTQYDAVVMPSRWEGLSIWALETLRSGRPLIGSNRGVFPYIIEDGVNGIIIDIDRPGFLNRAIAVLEKSDLPAMGAAARRTYEQTFRSDHMNEALVAVYRELAGGRPQETDAVQGAASAAYPPAVRDVASRSEAAKRRL
ncbi:MAG: glycosyltransferase [Hyphomicrobium sp.]|nr:glycosyltransferase [Hyphomicrobium sp.]